MKEVNVRSDILRIMEKRECGIGRERKREKQKKKERESENYRKEMRFNFFQGDTVKIRANHTM